ncbi:MAG: HD domain-containing protein [Thermoplasmata archaeon]
MSTARTRPRPRKSIFDPVHGPIRFDPEMLALLGSATVQRLWGVRQTGFAHLVFPGANHTRLEHSLGTYWTARGMAEAIDLSAEERRVVAAAGLLHDIGHPPFSHTLDGPLAEALGTTHEGIGRALILGRAGPGVPADPRLREELERAGISPRAVADLIDPPARPERRPLLRQLLHGAIDADRIDYLQRDAHYTGVAHGFIDAARLLATIDQEKGRLVFAAKGRSAIEGFLVGWALMYASVYYHKTVRAAETMAQAAVERSADFRSGTNAWVRATDGELLARLQEEGGPSRELVRGLIERRLFKRIYSGSGPTDPSDADTLGHGPDRRALEDRWAERAGAPEGSVLIDPAAFVEHRRGHPEWAEVALKGDDRLEYPFRRSPLARFWGDREPSISGVAVYADVRWHETLRRRGPMWSRPRRPRANG